MGVRTYTAWTMALTALFFWAPSASAKGNKVDQSALPELAKLLEGAGWEMTPDMSGAYRPGDVYDRVRNQRVASSAECFDVKPTESPYTSMEVTRSLEAGVRMNVVVAGGRAGLGITKKIVFDDPRHRQISRLLLEPSDSCVAAIDKQRVNGVDTREWFIITEVISAMIQKQECGSYDAKAGAFTLSGEVDIQAACIQKSLEPVAIAYKTIALDEVMPVAVGAGVAMAAPAAPVRVPSNCKWHPIKSFSTDMTSIRVNGESYDVRGVSNRMTISSELLKCGYHQAATAFDKWRKARRTVNIASGTIYGVYGVYWAASAAGKWRETLEREMNFISRGGRR
jgi:hypothetical protein